MKALFKKNYGLLLGIIACVIVFQIADTARFFGAFMNRFFSCAQNPASSFPCYGIYDIAMMIISFVAGLIFVGIVVFRLIQSFKGKA
jgi:uncharacterized membrane protein